MFIISKCLSNTKKQTTLHFQGFLNGEKITSIVVPNAKDKFKRNKDYLINGEKIEIKNNTLFISLKTAKELKQ
jgi:hypothetical protein